MNVNLRISIEQQRENVAALYADWVRIVKLCGFGSDQDISMFETYAKATKALAVREVGESR